VVVDSCAAVLDLSTTKFNSNMVVGEEEVVGILNGEGLESRKRDKRRLSSR